MNSLIIAKQILLVAILIIGSTTVHGQDRPWKNADGRAIIARAVAKDATSVTLRMTDGKRHKVELATLSADDQTWVASWSPPVFSVTTEEVSVSKDSYRGPIVRTVVGRNFIFSLGKKYRLTVFEDDMKAVINALHKFLELSKKELADVKSHEQIVFQSKVGNRNEEIPVVVFSVRNGKAHLEGHCTTGFSVPAIPAETVYAFVDYMETFSPREWDAAQKEINARFK